MNVYRINLRFDLDDERERMAAEYLQQFPQRGKTTRNRFAVDALCAYISRIEQDDRPLLESIRQMLREEIGGASITPTIPVVQTVNTELTEEQKEENRRNVLQDLDDLFG
jgi:hypothetical protein